MKTQTSRTVSWKVRLAFFATLAFTISIAAMSGRAPATVSGASFTTGAIFTTDVTCQGTNINDYTLKSDVYLDGGPKNQNAAGLPDGYYYVQVTEPNGDQLGTSVGSANPTPVHVTNGEFDSCYQLSAILIKTSDQTPGYDFSSNPGKEYKVWVNETPNFVNSDGKTDNFKVNEEPPLPPPQANLSVIKFYDANADGVNNAGDQLIIGWKITIAQEPTYSNVRFTPVSITLDPGPYVVTESTPIETNWAATTPQSTNVDLTNAGASVEFGNLCLGAGNGHTLGFWSNKNGQAAMGGNVGALYLDGLVSANPAGQKFFRKADGTLITFGTYNTFRTWILNATATNMAYMLSAQLAAMELNVKYGGVNGNALIYAPGATSANSLGYATVQNVMDEAENSLATNGNTVAAGATRTYQEALKNALDKANNNLNFVQATPCAFSFN